MENSLTRYVYDHSPIFMQHLYTTLYGLRKRRHRYGGKLHRQWFEFFKKSARWSLVELQEYQRERLGLTLRQAYEHVPFYRERFDAAGVRPADIRDPGDLQKLPLLEKSEVRAAGRSLLADNAARRSVVGASTSGSTGYPLMNWWSRETDQILYGFHWARCRMQVEFGQPYASFTGLQLIPLWQKGPPYWRVNLVANQRCYSVFHMSPSTMDSYLADLDRHSRVFFEGYPTPIGILARHLKETGYKFSAFPKAVYTTAEQLLPETRAIIEDAFQTRVWDSYGQNEKAGAITQYECGHLHYDMDYALIEFVPVERTEGGQVAELVCTTFYNMVAPLIRYRVGDFALLEDNPPSCSVNAGRIIRTIYGRTGQVIITADGRRISNISVIVKRCRNVKAVQCIQDAACKVRIRVICEASYSEADERNLLEQFRAKMGQGLEFQVEYGDEPILSRSGKFLSIISRLNGTASAP